MDRALSCATIPDQSGPGSNGNEEVLHIPQSSSITGTSPSDCLVSYLGHSSYPSAEVQSVYFSGQAEPRLRLLTYNILQHKTSEEEQKVQWLKCCEYNN